MLDSYNTMPTRSTLDQPAFDYRAAVRTGARWFLALGPGLAALGFLNGAMDDARADGAVGRMFLLYVAGGLLVVAVGAAVSGVPWPAVDAVAWLLIGAAWVTAILRTLFADDPAWGVLFSSIGFAAALAFGWAFKARLAVYFWRAVR